MKMLRYYFFVFLNRYQFTAISARNIELVFTLTGQIPVEGPSSWILKPWEHYTPLKKDGSNFKEVYEAIRDIEFTKKMIKNCYENIVECKELYYGTLAKNLINIIQKQRKTNPNDIEKAEKIIIKYENEMKKKYKYFFTQRCIVKKIENLLYKYPSLHRFAKNLYNKYF